ncbi:MAG: protein-L-isoaspartate(D-aspartate) O-methyltransferase [Anaerolineaceae bacterium]|nr:protein-L-isoaspartate(D-aspartate) O-methyltransferase [Anaerolineaceae bacterium]
MDRAGELRKRMVREQLLDRGIRDPLVLQAMSKVPRERFVPEEWQQYAYADSPLPIGQDQTISQPYVVAWMIEALEPTPEDRVLEVGTGSAYGAAVLSRIVRIVYTIERHKELAAAAERRLAELDYANVQVRHGDGTLGWPEEAPFDGIVVTASGPQIPRPLREQLSVGGRLVIPEGQTASSQELVRLHRISETETRRENLGSVRFVPLVGKGGWNG